MTRVSSGGIRPAHGVRVSLAANTALADGFAPILVAFDGPEDFDTDGYHDPVVNNSRLIVPAGMAGLYLVEGSININAAVAGDFLVRADKNGGASAIFLTALGSGGQYFPAIHGGGLVRLAAGDYVTMSAAQKTGVGQQMAAGATFLQATWLGI